MRTKLITAAVTAAACFAGVPSVAVADPGNATNLNTFTRTCGADVYETYKAGHGAAFVVGEDFKFVNHYNPSAAEHAGEVQCTYVQNETGFEGATTSRIVGGGKG